MTCRQSIVRLSAAALLLAVACGCGSNRPKAVPAKGTVTYKNEPVEGAAVMFQRERARPATGQTDADGNFTLTTFEPNDGAIPGDYVVTITKFESLPESTGDAGREPPKPAAGPPKSLIPQKYGDPKASGLKETVAAPGPNEFTFELKD